ncbi:hypothetical protein R1sor_018158 [Riccia sorocarpa]|uniref:Uncharacterized protein n=1 Tax=Riccia sorocarpa TaxID=122646 RepID=A0ABD3ICY2_9MARC
MSADGGLECPWAVVKLPCLPLQLPLFIACPWCQFLTFRITWKGSLKYPCKNFFLLWILEGIRGDSVRQRPRSEGLVSPGQAPTNGILNAVRPRQLRVSSELHHQRSGTDYFLEAVQATWDVAHWRQRLARIFSFFVQITSKLPLVFLFLFIICYVLPFSTLILAAYCAVTVVFAVPSFLMVYFSFPSLDWLAREIVT